MSPQTFQGDAQALSTRGFASVADTVGVHAAEIWTVLAVETSGCGYIADRRPTILYERHVFHRLTQGRFDDGDISSLTAGGYGAPGAHQYDRLAAAMAKDETAETAALQSASWGIGQIMGENCALAGFQDVQEMVDAMMESEDRQLAAMGTFLVKRGLDASLRVHDWTSFAKGYNGKNFAINRYDVRLNGEFQKFSVGVLPDLDVRAAQLYLTYLGFHPGKIDGIPGDRTLSALAQFQTQRGFPNTTVIDENTMTQLIGALTPNAANAATAG
jgi:hypothetical protein